jgi:hypothetical protein
MINFTCGAVPQCGGNMTSTPDNRPVIRRAKVSISDQVSRGLMDRREFGVPSTLLPDGIAHVRLPSGSGSVPALVACRSVLTQREIGNNGTAVMDQWRLNLKPYDEKLLVRSLAKPAQIGPADLPPNRLAGEQWPAGSDITEMMNRAHQKLTKLAPEFEGTMMIVVFWQDPEGIPRFDFIITSFDEVRRERRRALHHNRLTTARCAPFKSPIMLGQFCLWGSNDFVDVPEIPSQDTWVESNKVALVELVERYFKPALWSLWRATFADPDVSDQLNKQGYKITDDDRTMLGTESLGELRQASSQALDNLTVLGDMGALEELAAAHLEPLY